MLSDGCEALLRRAAVLASRGKGAVEPGPRVGAIAIEEERIVGEGWYRSYGGPHAEEEALEDAKAAGARPDCLVVSLEPCSSKGGTKKRPPCTELLIENGIKTVIFGSLDPDPRHGGVALSLLSAAGIVVQGPFELPELEAQLVQFRRAQSLGRSWLHAKWAMSLDGKTASRTGSSQWLSGPRALDFAHVLRARSDAVWVGIGTVLADDPELTVRRIEGKSPLRLVLDPDGDLPLESKLLQTARDVPLCLLVSENLDLARARLLESKAARLLRLPLSREPASGERPQLDLAVALGSLHGEGIRSVLVEGGSGLMGLLFDLGLVDQCSAVLAPKLCGGREAHSPIAGLGVDQMSEAALLHDLYYERVGQDLLFGGFVR